MRASLIQLFMACAAVALLVLGKPNAAITLWVGALVVMALRPRNP
jgi:hypothetical protein